MDIATSVNRFGPPHGTPATHPTWQVAVKLETAFLSEMLKASEPSTSPFGGSGAEDASQFGSFLRSAQVDGISRAGGIGLARQLFDAMQKQA